MLIFVCLTQVGITFAAHPDTGPGCGLGKLAWGDHPNQKEISSQILMSTTNHTSGSQSFGISSGTSGCTNNDDSMALNKKMNVFAALNFEDIAQDMAKGKGEYLSSLATLLGIPAKDHPNLFLLTQKQYPSLVRTASSSPQDIMAAMYRTMQNHHIVVQPGLYKK